VYISDGNLDQMLVARYQFIILQKFHLSSPFVSFCPSHKISFCVVSFLEKYYSIILLAYMLLICNEDVNIVVAGLSLDTRY